MRWVVVKVELRFPYASSLTSLLALVNVWNFKLFFAGTKRPDAVTGIQYNSFVKIFGEYPKTRKYDAPDGTENFINSVTVTKVS